MSKHTMRMRDFAGKLRTRYRQNFGAWSSPGRVCVLGALHLYRGMQAKNGSVVTASEIMRYDFGMGSEDILALYDTVRRLAKVCDANGVESYVEDHERVEVERTTDPYTAINDLIRLNDDRRVSFATFAEAFEIVSRQMEEREFGEMLPEEEPVAQVPMWVVDRVLAAV
jgi:hypothetical protein